MSQPIRITTLVDNTVRGRGLLGEHGLAFRIEYRGRHVLFDTGGGATLAHNAGQLQVDLAQTDTVVLSHGHYDHTGGLAEVLRLADRPSVLIHPASFWPKFSCGGDGALREVGMGEMVEQVVRRRAGELVLTEQPTEVVEGLFATGQIPRGHRI